MVACLIATSTRSRHRRSLVNQLEDGCTSDCNVQTGPTLQLIFACKQLDDGCLSGCTVQKESTLQLAIFVDKQLGDGCSSDCNVQVDIALGSSCSSWRCADLRGKLDWEGNHSHVDASDNGDCGNFVKCSVGDCVIICGMGDLETDKVAVYALINCLDGVGAAEHARVSHLEPPTMAHSPWGNESNLHQYNSLRQNHTP